MRASSKAGAPLRSRVRRLESVRDARPLRSVVLLAATELAISSCATAASNHHASTTTTTVTTTSTEIKEACTTRSLRLLSWIIGGGRRRSGAVTVHGSVFYGTAAASTTRQRSLSVASATAAESVAFQDHGAYPEFFERAGQSPWRVVGRHRPPGVMDCATFKDPPSGVRVIWVTASSRKHHHHNTRPRCVTLMADAFIQASRSLSPDGTATVKGLALEVQLTPGTPDDFQFYERTKASRPRRCTRSRCQGRRVNLGRLHALKLSALAHYLTQTPDANPVPVVGHPGRRRSVLVGSVPPQPARDSNELSNRTNGERLLADRSRCAQPGQQQGRR